MKIGIMSFAHMHAYSYAESINNIDGADLTAIFDDDEGRGKKVSQQFHTAYFNNQQEFLSEDLDAVIICSENNRHKEMVINAAKAKKHILCEKPISTNMEDANEMIKVCEEHNVIFQIAFPVRFSTPIQYIKKLYDDGKLGEIVAFRTTNRGQNPGGWFIDEEQSGGGAVLDHTVHMVDIMRWLLRKEVTEVYAIVDSYFHQIDTDDAGLLTLQFSNGVIASHDASWSRFSAYPLWGDAMIEIIGTKQSVKVDAFMENFNIYRNYDKRFEKMPYGKDMDFELIRDFIDCVRNNRNPSISGYDGLKALEVALAAYESNKIKDIVKL